MENTPKDKNKFASVMYGLAGNFGGKLSKDDLSLRFTALKEFSIGDISKAGTWLLKNREKTFPAVPTTKEIIDAIGKVSGKLDQKAKASIECDKVFKKLKEWGREAKPLFIDKTSLYLMTYRWTFDQLAEMNQKELEWFRKNFIESFIEMDKKEVVTVIEEKIKDALPASDLKKLLPENK